MFSDSWVENNSLPSPKLTDLWSWNPGVSCWRTGICRRCSPCPIPGKCLDQRGVPGHLWCSHSYVWPQWWSPYRLCSLLGYGWRSVPWVPVSPLWWDCAWWLGLDVFHWSRVSPPRRRLKASSECGTGANDCFSGIIGFGCISLILSLTSLKASSVWQWGQWLFFCHYRGCWVSWVGPIHWLSLSYLSWGIHHLAELSVCFVCEDVKVS